MKHLLLRTSFYALLLFLLVSCGDGAGTEIAAKNSYEVVKGDLLKKEKENPRLFLSVSNNNRKNFFGQTVIKGTLKNQATIAHYKDVELKLSFFSKTRALLETDKETIFEELSPGESTNFKTKYFAPKGTDSVHIAVLGAKIMD